MSYLAGSIGLQFWDFGGSTSITNNYIRLTEDHQSQKGYLWNAIVSKANDKNMIYGTKTGWIEMKTSSFFKPILTSYF